MPTRRSSRALAWVLLLLIRAAPSHALTKILVVPTARTMGAGRYAIDLDHKDQLFDGPVRSLTLTPKVGLGERVQLEMKLPLRGSNTAILFNGKYTFGVADNKKTAAAVGFESLGAGSQAIPYVVVSRLLQPVDLTLGIARGTESLVVYFTGIDYRPNENLHILADYNTGPKTFASAGFQYDLSRQWSMKSGFEARHDARGDLLIKVSYSGSY